MNYVFLKTTDLQGVMVSLHYADSVDECPVCLSKARMSLLNHKVQTYNNKVGSKLWVVYQCPNISCQNLFIAEFVCESAPGQQVKTPYVLSKKFPLSVKRDKFSEHIKSISPEFETIFNEAYEAEQRGLSNICGAGYRKALEYLIKDFCVSNHPQSVDEIKNALLSKVINTFVEDTRIKSASTRAAWLGNDEIHYIRKWDDKDLKDLKTLIKLTLHFVESEILIKSYEVEMPKNNG